MTPTTYFLYKKFDEYNAMCFGGSLPRVKIALNHSRRAMGTTRMYGRRGTAQRQFVITISVLNDLPEDEYIDTLLHEMIHYYIMYHGLADDGPHGTLFRRMMQQVSQQTGRRITVRFQPQEGQMAETLSNKWHYVAVVQLSDGRWGFCLPVKSRLFQFWRELPRHFSLVQMQWYASRNAIFTTYRKCLQPKIYILEHEKLRQYLTDALPLENTGTAIRPAT